MLHNLLSTVNRPQDLKNFSVLQMERLAEEIRDLLINTVANNGGHLAPNLGVVELTIAIHAVFDSPRDKIIWDVGHQAYVHKILTGRRDQFSTIRQFGGLSGFPKRSESEHDAFGTGHSSTSISAAVGMALSRDISGERHKVLAVIGDGSLTGGQAYEALDQAGHLGNDLTVILNDNEMSIARNVGAMATYLSKIRTDPTYSRVKRDMELLLRRIPAIGETVAKTAERMKDSFKYFLIPGMIFEELGFTYLGPIDGHNVPALLDVLKKAKTMQGPVLVHVITCKGKGYTPAECSADKFHGIGPFCIESGKVIPHGDTPTYTSVAGKALVELAEKDQDIVAITAAMPQGTGLGTFADRYPKRFFDVGIAEPHAITMAAAMAAEGKKPVIAIYSTFFQRAYDQVVHDVCLQELPVTFLLDRAGIVGEDGPTHHGVFDYAYLRHIPHMTIMAPKDENELRHMLFTAIYHNGPVAIRYPRGNGQGVPICDPFHPIEIGRSEKLCSGRDIIFLATGVMVEPCLEAKELLAEEGIQAGVVNARFVKPIDAAMVRELADSGAVIVTVEDHVLQGGFGSAVLECINSQNLTGVKLLRLGLPDQFIEHGGRDHLLAQFGLTADGIRAAAKEYFNQHGAK
ncbi:MAG: dxs 2 [Firmicutes bacterium]|nr:dxs 2 [Bacillota bacterium]